MLYKLMILFGNLNKKLIINQLDKFLFFIGKLDINCENKFIIKWQKQQNTFYYFVNLLNFTLEKTDILFSDKDCYLEISDNSHFSCKNFIYIIDHNDFYEVNFNYSLENEDTISKIIESYYVFEKTFDKKNYKFIKDELNFINSFNYNKNLNKEKLTITELFTKQIKFNKDNVAIKYKNLIITYEELYNKILKLSSLICKYTNVGESVSILLNKSENLIIVIWAIIFSGNNYVPIDPNDPKDRINFIIKNSNSTLLIYDNPTFDCKFNNKILINDINFNELEKNNSKLDNSNDLAYILHTSGTTGEPKGVKIRKEGVINYSLYQIETLSWSNKDIIVQKTPYIWDVSLRELVVPFLCGATVVVTENEKHKDPEYILNLIKKEKLTFVHFVPSMLNIFLEFVTDKNDLSSVKKVVCSGEALPDPLRIKFYKYFKNATLYNMYGPTEATVEVTNYICPKNDNDLKMHIGKTIPNTPLLILNKDGKILPPGIIGELHIGGIQVSSGYVNQDELTKKTFIENRYVNSKLYKTGDLAKLLPTNNIEYLGRIDSQIKIRGMRIEVSEIKKNILKLENITDCHVTLHNFNNKDFLIAYVSPKYINENDIINSISKFLPKQMIPDKIIKLDNFPISKNGKLEKKKLPIPNFENNEEINIKKETLKDIIKDFFTKESLIEEKADKLISLILSYKKTNIDINFLKVFSDLLNIPVEKIDIDLNLEYLGVDSIKMMKLQSLMKKNNYYISIKELERFKTINNIYKNLNKSYCQNDKNYNIEYYFDKINSVVDKDDKFICIHSNLPNLNLEIFEVDELFTKLVNTWINRGVTVLVPSFTTDSFVKNGFFQESKNLLETGYLADIIYRIEGSIRTSCPLYSFIVIGPNKDIFKKYPSSSLGENSVFELCEKINTKIIGIGTFAFTQFHRYEQLYNVPYRYFKEFNGYLIDDKGNKSKISQRHYVRDLDIDIYNLPDCEILDILGKKLIHVNIGKTFVKYINTCTMKEIFSLTFKDPFLILKNKKDSICHYVKNKNYKFDSIKVSSTPIINHFLNERHFENISCDFYQYVILEVKNFDDHNYILEKLENVLFHFSPLYYCYDNSDFYLDFNLRNFIKDKFVIIESIENIQTLIEKYSKKLNIENGNNFFVFFNKKDQELVILINHFYVDGVSWRLLIENLNNELDNNNNYEERIRFDTWSNSLKNINITQDKIDYWNDVHNSLENIIPKTDKKYLVKNCKVLREEIKISNNKQNINFRDYILYKLTKTIFKIYSKDKISINVETHGREDITFINNYNEIFGWFTSFFPITIESNNTIKDIEEKFKSLENNGIDYLLLNNKLNEKRNNIDILFNFMGDFDINLKNIKLKNIEEKGDCGHLLNFWFDLKSNNENGCFINLKLFYLSDFIKKEQIEKIIKLLCQNLLIENE